MNDIRNHTPYGLQPKCSKCHLHRATRTCAICAVCQTEQRKHDMNAARILAMWQPHVNFAMQSVLYI
jgi:hypothetical protein